MSVIPVSQMKVNLVISGEKSTGLLSVDEFRSYLREHNLQSINAGENFDIDAWAIYSADGSRKVGRAWGIRA